MIEIKEFLNCLANYHKGKGLKEGNKPYYESIKNKCWKNLDRINCRDFKGIILKFLNKWLCRLPYRCSKQNLKKLKEVQKLIKPLKKEHLANCNLKKHSKKIKNAFSLLRNMKIGKKRCGPTATSKILHMANQNLFVMNDKAIRKGVGVNNSAEGYFLFLKECKELAKKIPKKTINKYKQNTIPKLIDEANHYYYTISRRKS